MVYWEDDRWWDRLAEGYAIIDNFVKEEARKKVKNDDEKTSGREVTWVNVAALTIVKRPKS